MEDIDGGLSFDFEGGLDSGSTNPTAIHSDNRAAAAAAAAAKNNSDIPAVSVTDTSAPGSNLPGRRSFRQTVCRHWLRGLCMKGDACGFLHQYDKSRMPVCRFFRLSGECREQDCMYKHTNEDIKECNMYVSQLLFYPFPVLFIALISLIMRWWMFSVRSWCIWVLYFTNGHVGYLALGGGDWLCFEDEWIGLL